MKPSQESLTEWDTVCSGSKLQTFWRIQNVEGRYIPAKRQQGYTKRYGFTSRNLEMSKISTVRTAKFNMHVVNRIWMNSLVAWVVL